MSEREGSDSRSESSLSPGERRSPDASPKRSPSPVKAASRSRSRSRHRSPAREVSRSRVRHRSTSRSRSRSPRRAPPRRSRSRDYDRGRDRERQYYSRSRSRSPGYGSRRRSSRYSRSRSRSPYYRRGYSPSGGRGDYRRDGRRQRSRSRSPMSSRRRHQGNRDCPKANRCLGVFGLSLYTTERDLRDAFSKFGPIEELQIVYDHQTGRSRGFAFIYMRNEEDAQEAKERGPGMEIDGRNIRVDFSITQRAHTPTPGVYLGKPTRGGGSRRYSRSRSRSRSYSPRRY